LKLLRSFLQFYLGIKLEKQFILWPPTRGKPFLEVFSKNRGEDMDSIVKKVQKVLYLSSNSLRIFDEKLLMFLRVSNPSDIHRVESILKRRK
jgi:hypothetical protein